MSDAVVVTCPECEKKFRPKADVRGKKIKCPFCKEAFVVPAPKEARPDKDKSEAIKSGKPNPDGVTAKADEAPAPAARAHNPDFDADPDPYGVKNVELVPRCPNCTTEMGEHDIICLACGYNTLTRQWGKTEKTLGVTSGRQFLYLLPALGSAAFVVFTVLFLVFYCTVGPYILEGTMFDFLDHESMRMWTTVITLGWVFGAGAFCYKKFIEKPKPDEIQME